MGNEWNVQMGGPGNEYFERRKRQGLARDRVHQSKNNRASNYGSPNNPFYTIHVPANQLQERNLIRPASIPLLHLSHPLTPFTTSPTNTKC